MTILYVDPDYIQQGRRALEKEGRGRELMAGMGLLGSMLGLGTRVRQGQLDQEMQQRLLPFLTEGMNNPRGAMQALGQQAQQYQPPGFFKTMGQNLGLSQQSAGISPQYAQQGVSMLAGMMPKQMTEMDQAEVDLKRAQTAKTLKEVDDIGGSAGFREAQGRLDALLQSTPHEQFLGENPAKHMLKITEGVPLTSSEYDNIHEGLKETMAENTREFAARAKSDLIKTISGIADPEQRSIALQGEYERFMASPAARVMDAQKVFDEVRKETVDIPLGRMKDKESALRIARNDAYAKYESNDRAAGAEIGRMTQALGQIRSTQVTPADAMAIAGVINFIGGDEDASEAKQQMLTALETTAKTGTSLSDEMKAKIETSIARALRNSIEKRGEAFAWLDSFDNTEGKNVTPAQRQRGYDKALAGELVGAPTFEEAFRTFSSLRGKESKDLAKLMDSLNKERKSQAPTAQEALLNPAKAAAQIFKQAQGSIFELESWRDDLLAFMDKQPQRSVIQAAPVPSIIDKFYGPRQPTGR